MSLIGTVLSHLSAILKLKLPKLSKSRLPRRKKRNIKVSELNDFLASLPPLDKEDRRLFEQDLKDIRSYTRIERHSWA